MGRTWITKVTFQYCMRYFSIYKWDCRLCKETCIVSINASRHMLFSYTTTQYILSLKMQFLFQHSIYVWNATLFCCWQQLLKSQSAKEAIVIHQSRAIGTISWVPNDGTQRRNAEGDHCKVNHIIATDICHHFCTVAPRLQQCLPSPLSLHHLTLSSHTHRYRDWCRQFLGGQSLCCIPNHRGCNRALCCCRA